MVSSSQSLCLQCGLCCDGTVFSTVQLKPDDEVAPLSTANISIFLDNGQKKFKLPCAAHKNCICTVYANRPKDCQAYKCELLKRFEKREITQQAALEIINKILSVRNEVKALAIAASTSTQSDETSITEKILTLKNEMQKIARASSVNLLSAQEAQRCTSIGPENEGYAHVLLRYGVLQLYVDRYLRPNAKGSST